MPYHVGKPNEMLLLLFLVCHMKKKVSVYPRRVRLISEETGRTSPYLLVPA